MVLLDFSTPGDVLPVAHRPMCPVRFSRQRRHSILLINQRRFYQVAHRPLYRHCHRLLQAIYRQALLRMIKVAH